MCIYIYRYIYIYIMYIYLIAFPVCSSMPRAFPFEQPRRKDVRMLPSKLLCPTQSLLRSAREKVLLYRIILVLLTLTHAYTLYSLVLLFYSILYHTIEHYTILFCITAIIISDGCTRASLCYPIERYKNRLQVWTE